MLDNPSYRLRTAEHPRFHRALYLNRIVRPRPSLLSNSLNERAIDVEPGILLVRDRDRGAEDQRSEDTGVLQSFQLLTGELLHSLLDEPNNRIGKMLTQEKSNERSAETKQTKRLLAILARKLAPSVKAA